MKPRLCWCFGGKVLPLYDRDGDPAQPSLAALGTGWSDDPPSDAAAAADAGASYYVEVDRELVKIISCEVERSRGDDSTEAAVPNINPTALVDNIKGAIKQSRGETQQVP